MTVTSGRHAQKDKERQQRRENDIDDDDDDDDVYSITVREKTANIA